MKHGIPLSFLLFFALACGQNDQSASGSENDIDAARNFIRAALNSDFDKARTYMLQDSLNNEDLSTVVRHNQQVSPQERQLYREASIIIHGHRAENDSTSIIVYSNSYRQRKDSLKIVRVDGQWLVDLKYIFPHKTDSLP